MKVTYRQKAVLGIERQVGVQQVFQRRIDALPQRKTEKNMRLKLPSKEVCDAGMLYVLQLYLVIFVKILCDEQKQGLDGA
jgi:hypothetical protein